MSLDDLTEEDFWIGATMHILICKLDPKKCETCKDIQERIERGAVAGK